MLVRTSGRYAGRAAADRTARSWLLIKHRDEWSGELDITTFAPSSVKSDGEFEDILAADTPARLDVEPAGQGRRNRRAARPTHRARGASGSGRSPDADHRDGQARRRERSKSDKSASAEEEEARECSRRAEQSPRQHRPDRSRRAAAIVPCDLAAPERPAHLLAVLRQSPDAERLLVLELRSGRAPSPTAILRS